MLANVRRSECGVSRSGNGQPALVQARMSLRLLKRIGV
jgi:hypothetical protein